MIDRISLFIDLLKVLDGKSPDNELNTSLLALLRSEKAKVEEYFSQVVDQTTFKTEDYLRLKDLLVNLVTSLRTLVSTSKYLSDPRSLSNTDLDELFRSFGFPHSTKIRGIDENPLEQKIQLLYDLVNLYKIKGTPESIVRVLQYFGLEKFDLFELVLKIVNNDLFFESKFVGGTSSNPETIRLPFEDLTKSDPHWLLTKEQILYLNSTNKLNLPSQTSYIGVQTQSVIDGPEAAILSRIIQDQYKTWKGGGSLEKDAKITIINERRSLLELYVATVYAINKKYKLTTTSDRFVCYDGSSVSIATIFDEFTQIVSTVPIRRCDINDNEHILTDSTSLVTNNMLYCPDSKLVKYYELFTRPMSENFLKTRESAGELLEQINPSLKQAIDAMGDILEVILSLRKDLSYWVQSAIGLGFIDFSYVLFGLLDLFGEYRQIIEFFKPYHARFLAIMLLNVSMNRLFNTVIVNDKASYDTLYSFHDFVTADSQPCCMASDSTACLQVFPVCRRTLVDSTTDTNWRGIWTVGQQYSVNDVVAIGDATSSHFICIQDHTSVIETKPIFGSNWSPYWKLYSYMSCTSIEQAFVQDARRTYDCGSFHDIGSSTDIPKNIYIDIFENKRERLDCTLSSFFDSTTAHQVVHNSQYIDHGCPVYWQVAELRNFDGICKDGVPQENSHGFFDCWFPADIVEVHYEDVDSSILTEDEQYYITLEDGDKIIVT